MIKGALANKHYLLTYKWMTKTKMLTTKQAKSGIEFLTSFVY